MSLPAGTGVWVVNTVRSRAAAMPVASDSPECISCAGELNRGERGVALVEVDHAGLETERGQRAHAAGAEQDVLGEADVLVGLVQPAR